MTDARDGDGGGNKYIYSNLVLFDISKEKEPSDHRAKRPKSQGTEGARTNGPKGRGKGTTENSSTPKVGTETEVRREGGSP